MFKILQFSVELMSWLLFSMVKISADECFFDVFTFLGRCSLLDQI